jgi:hypothetical protein
MTKPNHFTPDIAQIDGGRQEFSVYLDEEGDAYRFEVSAPDNKSFDGVWDTVARWLKHKGERQWSEENLEFVIKALGRANSMKLLQLCEKNDAEIIPVADSEEANYEQADRRNGTIIDMGGSLTKLKAELESGAGEQGKYYKFQGPFDLESDLEGGVKIRLCNLLFADKATLED